ncbi:MAG: type II toxin-antitoxin system VapC family toxin [Candidatus Aenigmarchaeota archaeon]|nr:type II toxin-antitoxin system VapC family toxin [Candidatus Aenigmarchaeota archaeon]
MKNAVLDTSVLMEAKKGLTTIFSIVEYPKALSYKSDVLWPEKEDFVSAVEIMAKLYAIGKPVPAIDVLIAAMCINRSMELKTKDKHFSDVQSVESSLKVSFLK